MSAAQPAMQALVLNGTNQYATIANAPAIGPASITVSGWFIFAANANSQVLFCKSSQSTTNSVTWMVIFASNTLQMVFVDADGYQYPSTLYTWTPATRLHHIAFTFNAATNLAVLYVDGVNAVSFTLQVPMGDPAAPLDYDGNPMLIGAMLNNNVPVNFFSGTVYDVRLYNVVLACGGAAVGTQAPAGSPIGQLYNNGNPWFSDPTVTGGNPAGWWKLDEGTGTTINDSSGNGNNGTLINSPTWNNPAISVSVTPGQILPARFVLGPFLLTGTCSPIFLYNEITAFYTYNGTVSPPALVSGTQGRWTASFANSPPAGATFTGTIYASNSAGDISLNLPLGIQGRGPLLAGVPDGGEHRKAKGSEKEE